MEYIRFYAGMVIVASVLAGSVASARDRSMTISSGKRTLISSFAMYDSDNCTFGQIPVGKVSTPPQSGKIEFVEERRVVDAGNCGKIQGWARNVYFTPSRGFRGVETIRIDFQYNKWTDAPALVTQSDTVTLTVK